MSWLLMMAEIFKLYDWEYHLGCSWLRKYSYCMTGYAVSAAQYDRGNILIIWLEIPSWLLMFAEIFLLYDWKYRLGCSWSRKYSNYMTRNTILAAYVCGNLPVVWLKIPSLVPPHDYKYRLWSLFMTMNTCSVHFSWIWIPSLVLFHD